MKAQLQTLVASVAEKDAQIAEKDAKIAELEQGGGGQSLEQVLEQVRDARAGSVVLTVDPEGDTVTLGLTIEQSDNLIEWTKLRWRNDTHYPNSRRQEVLPLCFG